MTQNLTGKNVIHHNNLLGCVMHGKPSIPQDIRNIKIKIINTIIMPLISKQWDVLYENMFFLDTFKTKLDRYYQIYKLDDLLIYKDILRAFELVISEHTQLSDLEKKMNTINGNEFTSIVYKTTAIRLKPEYEVYDVIFGKPKREKNEVYNEQAILFIKRALVQENATFKRIQEQALEQFSHA